MKKIGYENLCILAVFIISAYIALFNLGHAALWHDEATNAIMARNLLTVGEYSGWDGRNLFVGYNGVAIDSNFSMVSFPPWPPLPSALGLWLLGDSEVALRFFHALLGVLSLLLLWLLLRLDFADRKRLQVLAFTLFALSAQALLFMRQGRYYADGFFFSLAAFYCYRLYWRDQRLVWLAGLVLTTVLNFLNHFAVGASFALAIASWHLIYHGRETSARQWGALFAAGLVTTIICLAYLWLVGIIGSDEQLEYSSDLYQKDWLTRRFYLLYYHARDVMSLGWLPLWVAVWWGWFVAHRLGWFTQSGRKKSSTRASAKSAKKAKKSSSTDNHATIFRWVVMALLVLFFTAMVSVQPVVTQRIVDSRYMIAVLPFLALAMAVSVDWFWQRFGAWAALPLLAILLVSNALSFPHIQQSYFSGEKLRWTLPQLLLEVHRPYATATEEVATYLRENADQDDTIYAHPWYDNALLFYYLSDQLIFCCALNEQAALPEDRVRTVDLPLYQSDTLPVWQVSFGSDVAPLSPDRYQAVYRTNAFHYPTQRPELEYHSFSPVAGRVGPPVTIFRRR